jgi:alpha,alpha-trehalase
MPAGRSVEANDGNLNPGAPKKGVTEPVRPGLRDRIQVTERDPGTFMSHFPPMMGFYAREGRDIHPDGLNLLRLEPRDPLSVIADHYLTQRGKPDWSAAVFTADHFKEPAITLVHFRPDRGVPIEDYTLAAREYLIVPPDQQPNGHTIQLPHPIYSAGSGRFHGHEYGWDLDPVNTGLRADGRWDQIRNNVDNTEDLIDVVGQEPNANFEAIATRAQMPSFVDGVTFMYERYGEEAILRYLDTAEKQYRTRMNGVKELSEIPYDGKAHAVKGVVRMPDGSILNRYYDSAKGPRQEMVNEDIELAELAVEVKKLSGADAEKERDRIYDNRRIAAASGRDFSVEHLTDPSRPETICIADTVPVDLNAKMFHYEEFLSLGYALKAQKAGTTQEREGYTEKSLRYRAHADNRWDSMEGNLYDRENRIFRNRNFLTGQFMQTMSASMAWVLLYGRPNPEAAFGTLDAMEQHLLYPGGIIATDALDSHEQWDGKRVWGNNNLTAARGAARIYHMYKNNEKLTAELCKQGPRYDIERFLGFSERVRSRYVKGTETMYEATGDVQEKFDGDNPSKPGHGGEYDTVTVFGMAVESYRGMRNWDPADPEGVLPIDPLKKLREELAAA